MYLQSPLAHSIVHKSQQCCGSQKMEAQTLLMDTLGRCFHHTISQCLTRLLFSYLPFAQCLQVDLFVIFALVYIVIPSQCEDDAIAFSQILLQYSEIICVHFLRFSGSLVLHLMCFLQNELLYIHSIPSNIQKIHSRGCGYGFFMVEYPHVISRDPESMWNISGGRIS